MTNRQLYADLPAELLEADDILRRYGRWARGGQSPARCGSAEGNYRAPQDDEDRQPSEPAMPANDVERVRKSLGDLPMMTLRIIQWLYVNSSGMHAAMRKAHIQPQYMRERHLEGVRLFWVSWKRNAPMTSGTIAKESVLLDNCVT